jgi:hypothetical protein
LNEIANSIFELTNLKSMNYSSIITRIDENNINKQYFDLYQSLL